MSETQRDTLALRKQNRRIRQQRRRKIWASISTLALALPVIAAFAAPTAANAAPNPQIVVDDVSLENIDGLPTTVGDTLSVSGAWDATHANPEKDDTFVIGLPSELGFTEPVPFELTGDGKVWGNCLTDPATEQATCTLTEAVEDNPELVKGTFEFKVEAIEVTTKDQVEFDLNGQPVLVDLPGDGGIGDGVVLPTEITKSGRLNDNKWSMTWTVEIPGAGLAGRDDVEIFDSLSDNHKLCEDPKLQVHKVRGQSSENVTGIADISTNAGDDHDFSIILDPGDEGFDPNVTYRLTYETCTLDGQIDDIETVYTNEAIVDGESTGEIGVEQDWMPGGKVTKGGWVRGGEDRNRVIDWTVTITGDHLAGRSEFTLNEELAGPHELCVADGDDFEIRVQERYGPSEALVQNLGPDKLNYDVTIDSNTQFTVDFNTVGDFAFEESEKYLYRIQYLTCATTDGLPAGGTLFDNKVTVEGEVAEGDAVTPGRGEGKSGQINTSFVELDGEEYFPQTTMEWFVRIPGEKVADLDGDLTLTDTLTDTHQVCGAGDDLKARLGLTVAAEDQISNGGLEKVFLTESATVELEGNELTFIIPQPELPQPDGAEAKGFSHEYQYLLSYNTCTESGGMDAPDTEYGNEIVGSGFSWKSEITQRNSGSGTGQGVSRGSIAIQKLMDEDSAGADFVANDTLFEVEVKELAPDTDEPIDDYKLQVPLNGDPVSGFNPRGNGWSVELSELTFPDVPGVTFGDPIFVVDGEDVTGEDGIARVDLTPGANIQVALTNSAELGSLEIEKVLEGDAADLIDADDEFSITAEIDVSDLGDDCPQQENREFTISKNASHVLEGLPIGAQVSFFETIREDDDVLTWGEAIISPEMVEIEADHASTPGVITVTNEVDRTVGTFTLSKTVTGDQTDNPAVPDEVKVHASWDEEGAEGEKTLILPTDGTTVDLGEELLIGTEVLLTEEPLEDGSSIAWGAPVWSGTGVDVEGDSALVTIGRDGEAHVSLENHAATSTAGISIVKGIAGEAADEVGSDTDVPVTASWVDENGETKSKELFINSQEPTELGEQLPAGTEVTITEGERPEIDTVIWDSITISGTDVEDNGDGSATVIVSDQQDDFTLVSITNEATWAPGTFSISKEVAGVLTDHPDVPDSVQVTATWLDEEGAEQSRELTVPTDGNAVALGEDLPHETEVTLSETPLKDAVSFKWNDPTWAGDRVQETDDNSAVVTIGAADTAEIVLTNEVSPVLGSIVLTKDLIGSGAAKVPSGTAFPVTATWTDLLGEEHQQTFDLINGKPVKIDDVPLGVTVQLTEGETDLPSDVRWKGAQWSTEDSDVELITGSDSTQATATLAEVKGDISLTNTVDEDTSLLPRTGTEILTAIGVGVLLVLTGLGLYRIRRSRA